MATFAIQDLSKQSGDNLLDLWAKNFDCTSENCLEFDTADEAQELIDSLGWNSFAGVVKLEA